MSQVGTWWMPSTHRYDLKAKWANETHIALAPAYAEIDAWEKVQLADDDAPAAEGEEGAAEEAEE